MFYIEHVALLVYLSDKLHHWKIAHLYIFSGLRREMLEHIFCIDNMIYYEL